MVMEWIRERFSVCGDFPVEEVGDRRAVCNSSLKVCDHLVLFCFWTLTPNARTKNEVLAGIIRMISYDMIGWKVDEGKSN